LDLHEQCETDETLEPLEPLEWFERSFQMDTRFMLIPYGSEFDPEIQGEGSIDSLGLAPFADRRANWLCQ
jgi:hypothetical protein